MVAARRIREGQGEGDAAWNPRRTLSPSLLKTYLDCPRKLRLQYIDKTYAPDFESIPMEQGKVAHAMLADRATAIRDRQPVIEDRASLFTEAANRLSRGLFPSPDAHAAAVADIVEWVEYGLSCIDRGSTFLNIESKRNRLFRLTASDPLSIEARPDLILLRTAPDGSPFVEIIDYKTGSKDYPDYLPPVTMRFVFKDLLQGITPDAATLPVTFIYVWLKHRDTLEIPLTMSHCEGAWVNVQDIVRSLLDEREWPAQPSNFCRYCKYHGHACRAFDAWQEREDSAWQELE
jgi:CRISPR/Cas system-associated exonuclease Cas4 (RecB family)